MGVNEDRVLPTSFYQERLWFLTRFQPGLRAHNVAAAVRIRGPLVTGHLQAAYELVVARHALLHIHFEEQNGHCVMAMAPVAKTRLMLWSDFGDGHQLSVSDAKHIAINEAKKPFEFTQGSLIRALLLPLMGESTVLLLVLHRLVADQQSVSVLLQELLKAYGAYSRGVQPEFGAVEMHYPHLASQQKDNAGTGQSHATVEYWRGLLAPPLSVLDLPTDFPRPSVKTYGGSSLLREVPNDIVNALDDYCARQHIQPCAALLAGMFALLSRYTRQDDIVIGVRTSLRPAQLRSDPVGPYDNVVPVRVEIDDVSFQSLTARVQGQLDAAELHAEYPFESLLDALHVERDTSHSPIFQAEFSFEECSPLSSQDPRHSLEPLELGSWLCTVDLGLQCRKTPQGLQCRLEYSTDLFHQTTIQRMARHFSAVLHDALAFPSRAISELRLMDDVERRLVTEQFNRTRVDYPLDRRLHDLLDAQAFSTPERPAVQFGNTSLSYQQFTELANQLAHRLRKHGVRRNVLVGVCMERSMELVIALHAVLRAGGAYAPLDPTYPKARLADMVEDASPGLILAQQNTMDLLQEVTAPVLQMDAELQEAKHESCSTPESDATAEDLAYVIFTSGSTGRPKGAMNAHRGICNRLLWMQDAYRLDGQDAVLLKTPFSFDVSVWEFFWPLMAGARLVVARPEGHKDPAYLAGTICAHQVTTIHFVPSMLRAFLDHPRAVECTSLTRVICSGEALPRDLQERFYACFDAGLYNLYGPTEAAVDVTSYTCVPGAKDTLVPIGRPIANTSIYIVDSHMEPTPVGVPGELCVGGVQVGLGYVNKPDLTAERFVPNPFSELEGARMYRTGDLARFRPDGLIEFLGRLDHQVKIRGQRIELEEIEAVLSAHPVIDAAIVQVRGDSPEDQRLVAYIVPQNKTFRLTLGPREFKTYLEAVLPPYMVPSSFVWLDTLPLTPSGKVNRRALPQPDRNDMLDSEYVAPSTLTEVKLAEIWSELLRLDRVGATDDFFAIGGHSLLAVRMVNRIRENLSVDIPLREVFQWPTVSGIAERVSALVTKSKEGLLPPIKPVNRDQRLPLSFSQEQLWFLDQMAPGITAYNVPVVLRLRGSLDITAMQRALTKLVDRHEALRTMFPSEQGAPYRMICPRSTASLSLLDYVQLDSDQAEAEARSRLQELARTAFDLEKGSLLKAELLRVGKEDHIFCVVFHHIIFDGWSIGPFVQDLSEAYNAYFESREPTFKPLAVQGADFAVWQREDFALERLDASIAFWKDALAGNLGQLDLPTDRLRPASVGFAGAVTTALIPSQVVQKLQALSRVEGTTLYATLLTFWQLLLKRYSGQNDVVSGSAMAGREWAALESVVDFFVNTVVIRTRVEEKTTVREAIRAMHANVMAVQEHQYTSIEKIVAAVCPERDAGRNPLFQVMFLLQNAPEFEIAFNGLEGRIEYLHNGGAKFDLLLEVDQNGSDLEARLEYNVELYCEATARRMMDHFVRLLTEGATKPDAGLADLQMLSPDECSQMMTSWNATDTPYSSDKLVNELFERQAFQTPAAVAAVFEDKSLCYCELNERAERLANWLTACGVSPGACVGICMERNLGMVVAVLGILKSGAAYVPLDPVYPVSRLSYMLDAAHVETVVTESHLRDLLPREKTRPFLIDSEGIPLGMSPDAGHRTERAAPNTEDNAYVIFTSGSTGEPKGVQVPHRAVVNFLQSMVKEPGLSATDVLLAVTTLSFDIHVLELLGPLVVGGTVAVCSHAAASDGSALLKHLRSTRATVLQGTPTTWRLLVEAGWQRDDRVKVLVGGEALPSDLLGEMLRRVDGVWNMYGPTETTVWSACSYLTDANAPILIGRPIANTQFYVVDELARLVPPGVPGELLIGGLGVAKGYIGRQDLTEARFLSDQYRPQLGLPVYRTGDLVVQQGDGNLRYLRRLDTQVKLRGYRIELGEIESCLGKHEAVTQAVCAIREDLPGDRRLVAYYTCHAGVQLEQPDLRTHLAAYLPAYMLPSLFVRMDTLPLTPAGKVDRRALPQPNRDDARGGCFVAPRTPVESVLTEIWSTLLGIERISVVDNFFELGGHSLLAVRVVSRVQDAYNVRIPVSSVFSSPTIESLALAVEDILLTELEQMSDEEAEKGASSPGSL